MEVDVIKKIFKSHGYDSFSYKIINVKHCCKQLIQNPLIDFYYQPTENTNNPIEDDFYGYDLGIMLREDKTYHDAWDYDDYGYDETFYYKLSFCPFCGEKIHINIIGTEDVTEEYNKLSKERDETHKKCVKTDSKKKEHEYLNKIKELDRMIESFYHTDYLPGKDEYNE